MARVKTFTNSGSLLPGDLNSIEDDYEFGYSTYKDHVIFDERAWSFANSPVAGTFILGKDFANSQGAGTPAGNAGAVASNFVFYLDPADRLVGARINKYRVRAQVIVNAVAPTTNWTVGLYPVTSFAGGSGNPPIINTLGAVITGSTIVFTAPALNTQTQSNSGDFNAPAAGFYVLAVVNSGSAAVGSATIVRAVLQNRHV
jgi:hypothetical protein